MSLSIALIITDAAWFKRLRPFIGAVIVVGAGHEVARNAALSMSDANTLAFTQDHAVVFLTSGTTGISKTVGLTHSNITCNLESAGRCFPERLYERTYVHVPMCHSYGFTLQMLASLVSGGTLYIGGRHMLSTNLAHEFAASECTSVFGVPTMFRLLVDGMNRAGLAAEARRVRYLVNGAAAMTDDLLKKMRATFPNALTFLTYGLSEASPLVTSLSASLTGRKGCSIGSAVDGVDLKLMTDDGQTTTREGAVGEIIIRGGSVITRYMGQSAANSAAFHGGYLKTGDIAAIDSDGCLYLRGRIKELINRGGEKIYPGDVEEVLLKRTEIAEAAVVPLAHPLLGEVPFAFLKPFDGHDIDLADLRKWCALHLAPHEVPFDFELVADLPKTHTGKLRRNELAATLRKRGGA